MRYDFTKVQEHMAIHGLTLRQAQDITGVHASTIHVALRTGRAHQSTALKLTKAFRISMKDIQVRTNGRKTA